MAKPLRELIRPDFENMDTDTALSLIYPGVTIPFNISLDVARKMGVQYRNVLGVPYGFEIDLYNKDGEFCGRSFCYPFIRPPLTSLV